MSCEFVNNVEPVRNLIDRTYIFSKNEEFIIENEIENMLNMEVIEEVEFSDDRYLSPISTIPKKDGEHWMILNLKDLNEHIVYHHFKMDTFEIA